MGILKISLSATVLILAIVIIRALLLHKLPKKTFLALWGIALYRLLIPFSIPSRLSIYTVADMVNNRYIAVNTAVTVMPSINIGAAVGTTNTALAEAASISISPIVVIWLIGLIACALFFVGTHLRCRREYKTAIPIDNKLVKDWQLEYPTKRNVQIRHSDKIAAPLTYGVFLPVILLPKTTDWTDEKKLLYILTHELVHIRRFDTLKKWLLATALCVHWFNPFVWVMYVLANRDIELSCDEAVVQTFGDTMKSAYALTLIGMEEKKSKLTPLVNNFSKNAIEERINSIMKLKKTSLMGISLALMLVIGTATIFATSASASKSDSVPEDSVEPPTENEDTVIRYPTPGTPDNHSGYTEEEYATLMALKTDNYRQMTTCDFLDVLKQNSIDIIYGGYNLNDENIDFLKTLQYSMSELFAEWDAEYGQTPTTSIYSAVTASNKMNADGEYYGAALDFTLSWTGTEQLTVGERDDTLNATLGQIQQIVEQKTESQIGNIKDLDADFQELAGQISNSKITVVIQINEYSQAVPDQTEQELLIKYSPYGISFDQNGKMYFKNELVRYFYDGANLGDNTAAVRYEYLNEEGTVDVHTTRKAADNGDGSIDPFGELTGIEEYSQAEFEQRNLADLKGSSEAVTHASNGTSAGETFAQKFSKYEGYGIEYKEQNNSSMGNVYYNGQLAKSFVDESRDSGVFTFQSVDGGKIVVHTVYDENGELIGVEKQ